MILVLILAEIKLQSFIECSNITKLQNRINITKVPYTSITKYLSKHNPGMW